jgi:hypothetical protein
MVLFKNKIKDFQKRILFWIGKKWKTWGFCRNYKIDNSRVFKISNLRYAPPKIKLRINK